MHLGVSREVGVPGLVRDPRLEAERLRAGNVAECVRDARHTVAIGPFDEVGRKGHPVPAWGLGQKSDLTMPVERPPQPSPQNHRLPVVEPPARAHPKPQLRLHA